MRKLAVLLTIGINLISMPAIAGLYEGMITYTKGDYTKAIIEFKPLALNGNATAQNNLAVMYDNGQGISKDLKEAVKWYSFAAKQGNAIAQLNLGLMYYDGQGLHQNFKEAIKWYRLAAKQDNADAQFSIGLAYYTGSGVPLNLEESIKWFNLAANQGQHEAIDSLEKMYAKGQLKFENGAIAQAHFLRLKAKEPRHERSVTLSDGHEIVLYPFPVRTTSGRYFDVQEK